MKNIDKLLEDISETRDTLLSHPLYSSLKTEESIAKFMETHVFAVWDFMSLVKALQINLTSVAIPWTPTKDNISRRLINEIVLGEESDIDQNDNPISHFELYIEAMKTIGANTKNINNFISNVNIANNYYEAVETSKVPKAAKDFMDFTFDVIKTRKTHIIASVFTFGREDLIPDMFINIVKSLNSKPGSKTQELLYYLERHIEMDGDEHGPMALKMISGLCGNDQTKWSDATKYSISALKQRIKLWDFIYNQI